MNPAALTIEITGMEAADATLQAIRNTLADRRPLHAEMAVNALSFTREYLISDTEHKTAKRLGASPTNFRARQAAAISARSDDDGAILVIPRSTGLGRAFGDITIKPLGGKTFITIPAGPETYGRQPGEWSRETFRFAVIQTHRGPTPVLVWAETAGRHEKGDVAFWLRRQVIQKQTRELLPSDEEYRGLGRDAIISYVQRSLRGYDGPQGGTSTGMPSA